MSSVLSLTRQIEAWNSRSDVVVGDVIGFKSRLKLIENTPAPPPLSSKDRASSTVFDSLHTRVSPLQSRLNPFFLRHGGPPPKALHQSGLTMGKMSVHGEPKFSEGQPRVSILCMIHSCSALVVELRCNLQWRINQRFPIDQWSNFENIIRNWRLPIEVCRASSTLLLKLRCLDSPSGRNQWGRVFVMLVHK